MTPDQYLQNILTREGVDTSPYSLVKAVQNVVEPICREWAGNLLVGVSPSGSFAKGTANSSGTDIDLFVSLSPNCNSTLSEIYNSLYEKLRVHGYSPRRQNVSIGITVNQYDVDVVPARRQSQYGEDHSLYRSKAQTWTKTNVSEHIALIRHSRRLDEIRVVKLWRNQKKLEFPSFYLELSVIRALQSHLTGALAANVMQVFKYLRDEFERARINDPSNTNNIISDDLNGTEKSTIRYAASNAISAPYWGDIVKCQTGLLHNS